ncbi:hypothetical protein J6590_003357 [Homalodisca vitripennis]|nr:hypothetical protein J6590_003357 [Homalodisca vitripennis]
MATDVLTNKLETTLHITRTVGDDRIKKAKENNEDIAVLSTFLPPSLADAETQAKTAAFVCALGPKCILGDPKKTTPGAHLNISSAVKKY